MTTIILRKSFIQLIFCITKIRKGTPSQKQHGSGQIHFMSSSGSFFYHENLKKNFLYNPTLIIAQVVSPVGSIIIFF
jgi:hypothetical protein